MRAEFAKAMCNLAKENDRLIFLTGDLGFKALESVQEAFGRRFFNAGVAEQNMVSVAAGLASKGFIPLVYSIAPFATFRPYEQIRDDVCLHGLPVKIVGNGGGFGYGIMGATHHALEDIGAMRVLPGMKVYLPVFDEDVHPVTARMLADEGPGYLRLNLGVRATVPIESFQPWRRLTQGNKAVAVTTGTVVGGLLDLITKHLDGLVEVWSVGTFPFGELPAQLLESIQAKRRVLALEEHVAAGGLGEALASRLLVQGVAGNLKYMSASAKGYPSGRYGSQKWHLEENSLAGNGLLKILHELCDL